MVEIDMIDCKEIPGEIHKRAMLGNRNVPTGKAEDEIRGRYYDISNTITVATAVDPGDADAAAYQQERIYDTIQRRGDRVTVTNDIPLDGGTLFVRVAHDGMNTFGPETPIYPQQFKTYFNVYELRLRSPMANLPYRVTEYIVGSL